MTKRAISKRAGSDAWESGMTIACHPQLHSEADQIGHPRRHLSRRGKWYFFQVVDDYYELHGTFARFDSASRNSKANFSVRPGI
jgi:hypothetical protein